MSKKIKEIMVFILMVLIIIGAYIIYRDFGINGANIKIFSNKYIIFLVALISIIILVYLVKSLIFGRKKNRELLNRDKLFNSLVQNSNTVYAMYDITNRNYTYITKNIAEVLDIKIDESELKTLDELFDIPVLKNEIDAWNKKNEFVSQMISYKGNNYQHNRWIKVKIYPFKEKKAKYAVIVISDVTKEHDQQHMLVSQASDIKTREKQLNEITSISYDVEIEINMTTNDYILHNLKDNFYYLGNNRNGKWSIEVFEDYVFQDDLKFIESFSTKNLNKLIENNNLEPITIRYRLNNMKETIWLESTAFFTTDRGEVHVTILTKNVTENAEYMRNQNILLQNALEESKHANSAKNQYLAIMSHEIRTPMNAIIGLSSSILNEDLPKDIREDVENINSASNSLLDVIDGILDISKIESGILSLDEKEYSVPKFFKDIETLTKENITNKNVKFVLNIDPNTPCELYGDSGKIRQIIQNLLNNSIKFTKKGTITVNVKTKKDKNNAKLIVSVIDTGVGIERKKLEHLFNEKTDDNNYIEGMGLVVSKKIIDLLKGEISVQSEVGQGTIFTISIDQKIVDNKMIGKLDEFVIKKKKNNSFNAKGKKILVVDDNKLNLKVAEKLLKPYNVVIETLTNGEDTIKKIKQFNQYDLILLDQMMPEMDGTTTLKELKKLEGFRTPIIVLTADAIVGKKEEYLKAGFNDYLSKPINNDELYRILKKYLRD